MSVWKYLLVRYAPCGNMYIDFLYKPMGQFVHGTVCYKVFLNGTSGLSLQKLFGVIVIFNAKFTLDLGMVRI